MINSVVGIVRYEKPMDSVRTAVELSGGLDRLSADSVEDYVRSDKAIVCSESMLKIAACQIGVIDRP